MKSVLFVTAIMFAGAAAAQTTTYQTTTSQHTTATTMSNADIPNPGELVSPANTNPERDARGIPVISAPAVVPTGFNVAAGLGGPEDTTVAAATTPTGSYPPCTREVTDNCVQTYEVGRNPN